MFEVDKLGVFFVDFVQNSEKEYIDLHIHTKASDGLIDLKFLKEFLIDKEHVISITDHNEIRSNIKLYDTSGMHVVPGIEVGCKDGFEFLVYFKCPNDLIDFYIKYVEPFKNKNKICRTKESYYHYLNAAREYNSFISIPHIAGIAQKNYLKNKSYIYEVLNQVDALEIYNHSLPENRNIKAQKIREIKNKLITFGSDAHIKREIISFYNYQNSKLNKSFYLRKKLYNLCSICALFGKHVYQFLEFN